MLQPISTSPKFPGCPPAPATISPCPRRPSPAPGAPRGAVPQEGLETGGGEGVPSKLTTYGRALSQGPVNRSFMLGRLP